MKMHSEIVQVSSKLSDEHFERILKSQNDKCPICQKLITAPIVDYISDTLRVRGILCRQCDKAIRLLNSDPEILRKAADYLEK